MRSCDVLIVGGGPAGSSCAWALRESGLDVVIADRATFPRHKVCGGWITPQVVEELSLDLRDYARTRVLQPITAFRVGTIGGSDLRVPFGLPVSYGIRRCEFDDYLLRRSGAELLEGVMIRTIEHSPNGWTINGELSARMLVGAGGHFCPISRAIGNAKDQTIVAAQEIEFEMKADQAAGCDVHPETPELYFSADFAGYGWCFRKGNFLNVGLGRLGSHALKGHIDDFVAFLRNHRGLKTSIPMPMQGHAYLLSGHSRRKLVDDQVLLIGDSAGLAYPQSGEGIRPAIESGLMGAEVIKAAASDYRRERIGHYRELLAARFENEAAQNDNASPAWRNMLGRLLLKNPYFCKKVVVENWFLHRHVPVLQSSATGPARASHAA